MNAAPARHGFERIVLRPFRAVVELTEPCRDAAARIRLPLGVRHEHVPAPTAAAALRAGEALFGIDAERRPQQARAQTVDTLGSMNRHLVRCNRHWLAWSFIIRARLTHSQLECTVAAIQGKAPKGTTITGAEMVAAAGRVPCALPRRWPRRRARQRGELPPRRCRQGWNGKLLFLGVGGLGGTIANRSTSGLVRGYASASTDTGHRPSDPNWWSNRAKEIDYGYRGTHVTAVASKAIDRGVLRQAAAARLFQRLLERRAAGDDGSAALSRRLRRHHRRTSGHRHADAGGPRHRVSAHARVDATTSSPTTRSSCSRRRRSRRATTRTDCATG